MDDGDEDEENEDGGQGDDDDEEGGSAGGSDLLQSIQRGVRLKKAAPRQSTAPAPVDNRSTLLQSIQRGVQLNKVQTPAASAPRPAAAAAQPDSVADILSKAMARRAVIASDSDGTAAEGVGAWGGGSPVVGGGLAPHGWGLVCLACAAVFCVTSAAAVVLVLTLGRVGVVGAGGDADGGVPVRWLSDDEDDDDDEDWD